MPSLTGIGGRWAAAEVVGKRLDREQRPLAGLLRQTKQTVEIELGRRQHAANCGLRPKDTLASPRSLIARSSGPYWNSICSSTAAVLSPLILLLMRHGSMMTPPAARARPAAQDCSEPSKRGTPLSIQTDVSTSTSKGGRSDRCEPHPHAAVVAGAAGRDPVGIVLAAQHEGAFAVDRAEQAIAARRGTPAFRAPDAMPLALSASITRLSTMSSRSIESASGSMPIAGAGQSRRPEASSPTANSAPSTRTSVACHSPRSIELSENSRPSLARAHRAGVARPGNLDALQCQRGRRQEPRFDRPGDAQRAGRSAGLPEPRTRARYWFQSTNKRPDQRRHQRQDDRDRKTEQRRLHAVSKAGLLPGAPWVARRNPGPASTPENPAG